ncbi:hypothetical protein [Streptomyces sp. CBMA152]|nr:hypothetical protein [Streptomyces sp. CBMA152]
MTAPPPRLLPWWEETPDECARADRAYYADQYDAADDDVDGDDDQ